MLAARRCADLPGSRFSGLPVGFFGLIVHYDQDGVPTLTAGAGLGIVLAAVIVNQTVFFRHQWISGPADVLRMQSAPADAGAQDNRVPATTRCGFACGAT